MTVKIATLEEYVSPKTLRQPAALSRGTVLVEVEGPVPGGFTYFCGDSRGLWHCLIAVDAEGEAVRIERDGDCCTDEVLARYLGDIRDRRLPRGGAEAGTVVQGGGQ